MTFKISFIILWMVYILIRIPFDKDYKKQQVVFRFKPAKERLIITVNFICLLFLPLIWVLTPLFNSFNINLPEKLRYFGIFISAFSLLYFWWIHKTLGKNWSPILEIRKGHQLITSGPYKNIRHPMYLQILLWTIAQFFIISNWIAGTFGIVAWLFLYFWRVPYEEKMMMEKFGEQYINYMHNTGRIIFKAKKI